MISSGTRNARVDGRAARCRSTEAGWCSVFHQSTENLMIGMLIAADQRQRLPRRAPRATGSSIARHSAIRPRYIRNSISTEVSRASHTHYVPHIGLPQSEPVTSARKVNAAPIGAAAFAATSASGCRQTSVPSAASAHHALARTSTARRLGTWMNMILHRGALLVIVGRASPPGRSRSAAGSRSRPPATAARVRSAPGSARDWRDRSASWWHPDSRQRRGRQCGLPCFILPP